MKSLFRLFLAAAIGCLTAASYAQGPLGRLETQIRTANGQPATVLTPGQRVYLGAIANDEAGRGVRITSIRAGGPAEQAGLQVQDLVVGAAGRRIHLLSELTTILSAMNPGDRLALETMRGTKPVRVEVILGTPPGAPGVPHVAERPSLPTPGEGAGPTEAIPPPPGDLNMPAPPDGPALIAPQPAAPQPAAPQPDAPQLIVPQPTVPQPTPPNSSQAQLDDLRHRLDLLEQRVKELERELAEARKK